MSSITTESEDEGKSMKQKEIDEMLSGMSTHPAFATEVDMDNLTPEMEALMALKYEDTDSPKDKAEAYKEEGNYGFKYKKYRRAIDSYTEAIRALCSDKQLNAILHSNRAAAHARLGNRRSAIKDCICARKFNPSHMKAIIKGIECFTGIGDYDNAIKWCDEGLSIEAGNTALIEARTKADQLKKVADRNRRKEKLEERKTLTEDEKLLEVVQSRGCRLERGPSLAGLEPPHPGTQRVWLDTEGRLHWPLLLLYPEHGETDIIRDAREDVSPYDLLHEVLSEEQPPAPWDPHRRYTPSSVELWFEDRKKQKLYEVTPQPLRKMLSHPQYVITAGTPAFIVLVKQSPFKDHFMAQYD